MLKPNDKAPSFELQDQEGITHRLSEYKGKIVLYFYPKDDTPGCTKEACNFRDDFSEFKEKWIAVIGISADTVEKHKKFQEKYSLPFTLLSDLIKETIKKYEAYGEKKFMGKTYFGIKRMTFLIEDGIIKKIYPKVNVSEHSKEILEFF